MLEKFVEYAKTVEKNSSNGELDLLAYRSYSKLFKISERARNGDGEADRAWKDLPARIREFYPGLNYINPEIK